MHRFYVFRPEIVNDRIVLPVEIAHQVRHVLRLKSKDRIRIFDDKDHEWISELELNPKDVTAILLQEAPSTPFQRVELALFFSLTQRSKVELILQKCTEIGVREYYPLVASRSLARSTGEVEQKRLRWEKIICEAIEQSNQNSPPRLNSGLTFDQAVRKASDFDLSLIAWENENLNDLRDLLCGVTMKRIALMIGPEGGFEDAEIQSGVDHGWKLVTLGRKILRMETAAIVGSALILHDLGE